MTAQMIVWIYTPKAYSKFQLSMAISLRYLFLLRRQFWSCLALTLSLVARSVESAGND